MTTVQLARTRSAEERQRRAMADAVAAAELSTQAKLDAEIAATRAEVGRISSGAGDSHTTVAHNEDTLTLVCLADGATVRVPMSAAAAESELIRSMLEDANGSAAGTVLQVPWLRERQAMAFAAFLRDQAVGTGHTGLHSKFKMGLYNAASYLIAPRWQQQLANNLGSQLVKLAHKRGYEAVNAWAKREEVGAALDPVASSLIAMLSSEVLATLLIAFRRHQDYQRWCLP